MNATAIPRTSLVIALLLAAVMAATRFHHFGSAISLPDASLAIFFLAGFYLRSPLLFAGFLAEAALVDYLAITYGGVSDWCISPAYVFLIPTYASAETDADAWQQIPQPRLLSSEKLAALIQELRDAALPADLPVAGPPRVIGRRGPRWRRCLPRSPSAWPLPFWFRTAVSICSRAASPS